MLANRANPNRLNYKGATALIYASTFGRTNIVKHPTDKSLSDNWEFMALKRVQMQETTEIEDLLKKENNINR